MDHFIAALILNFTLFSLNLKSAATLLKSTLQPNPVKLVDPNLAKQIMREINARWNSLEIIARRLMSLLLMIHSSGVNSLRLPHSKPNLRDSWPVAAAKAAPNPIDWGALALPFATATWLNYLKPMSAWTLVNRQLH